MPDAAFFASPAAMKLIFWVSYGAWGLMEIWIFSRDLKKGSGEKKDRGSVFFIIVAITAGITMTFMAPHIWPWAKMALPYGTVFWTGIAMVWSGIVLRVWAVLTLGRHFRTAVRILDGHKLVTSGPYRYLRHPSYTGGLITVTGIGLCFANWISLAAAFGGIFIGYGVRILIEEAALRAHFGAEFETHKKRTWAVLPPLW